MHINWKRTAVMLMLIVFPFTSLASASTVWQSEPSTIWRFAQEIETLGPSPVTWEKATMKTFAPRQPHVIKIETGEFRVVFSRIDGDISNGPVAYYEAVFPDGRAVQLENNFLTLTPLEFGDNRRVAFRAVFDDGERGNLSGFIEIPNIALTGTDEEEPVQNAGADDPEEKEGVTLGGGRDNSSVTLQAVSVPVLKSPFFGPFKMLSSSDGSNQTDGPWTFWVHQSGLHRPGGGIDGANDTYAADVNLNIGTVVPTGNNLDVGMDFFAVSNGFVVSWHGTIPPGTGATRPVLIEHSTSGGKFWSGYLHAAAIFVRAGDYVTTETRIGRVGRGGIDNDHLHLVIYTGVNVRTSSGSQLVSLPMQINQAPLNFSVPSTQGLRVGETRRLTTTASGIRPYAIVVHYLNEPGFSENVRWKSSNTSIASVSNTGDVRGVGAGTTVITVFFSGGKASVTVTVANNPPPPAQGPTARMTLQSAGRTVREGGQIETLVSAGGNTTATLDASMSTAGSSPISQVRWYSNGTRFATGTRVSYVFGPGNHLIDAEVIDQAGRSARASARLVVSEMRINRLDPVSPFASSSNQPMTIYGTRLESTSRIELRFPSGQVGALQGSQIGSPTSGSVRIFVTFGTRGQWRVRTIGANGVTSNWTDFTVR